TTKRHPSLVRHRTALTTDGRLLAQDIEVVLDGGAYVTLSPVVLSRGIIHAAGPYACDNVRIVGRAMFTNAVPFGAFRGFGAPQRSQRRGIGLASFYHGAGFTGGGEVHLNSRLQVAGLPDGRVEVLSANIEMGQGTLTVFTQIAADRLGLAPEEVVIGEPDTA